MSKNRFATLESLTRRATDVAPSSAEDALGALGELQQRVLRDQSLFPHLGSVITHWLKRVPDLENTAQLRLQGTCIFGLTDIPQVNEVQMNSHLVSVEIMALWPKMALWIQQFLAQIVAPACTTISDAIEFTIAGVSAILINLGDPGPEALAPSSNFFCKYVTKPAFFRLIVHTWVKLASISDQNFPAFRFWGDLIMAYDVNRTPTNLALFESMPRETVLACASNLTLQMQNPTRESVEDFVAIGLPFLSVTSGYPKFRRIYLGSCRMVYWMCYYMHALCHSRFRDMEVVVGRIAILAFRFIEKAIRESLRWTEEALKYHTFELVMIYERFCLKDELVRVEIDNIVIRLVTYAIHPGVFKSLTRSLEQNKTWKPTQSRKEFWSKFTSEIDSLRTYVPKVAGIVFRNCSIESCRNAATKTCVACKSRHYCSKSCQRADWARHKLKCSAITESIRDGQPFPMPPKRCDYFDALIKYDITNLRAFELVRKQRDFIAKNPGLTHADLICTFDYAIVPRMIFVAKMEKKPPGATSDTVMVRWKAPWDRESEDFPEKATNTGIRGFPGANMMSVLSPALAREEQAWSGY